MLSEASKRDSVKKSAKHPLLLRDAEIMEASGWGSSLRKLIMNIPVNPHHGWKNAAIPDQLFLFEYEHLPDHLQEVSKQFWTMAMSLWVNSTRPSSQFEIGLQKLLEAKDCLIRAKIVEYERPFPAPPKE